MSAFENCESLLNISIPESVEIIEKDAFGSCKNLKEVYLPHAVEVSTSDSPFSCCKQLKKVICPYSFSTSSYSLALLGMKTNLGNLFKMASVHIAKDA